MRYLIITALLSILFSNLCPATEYYRFTDENGAVIFTDDISRVPRDQRPEIEVTKGVESYKPGSAIEHGKNSQDREGVPGEQISDKGTDPKTLEVEAEELRAIKAELDREAEEIGQESLILVEQANDLKGVEEISHYNEKAEALNERIKVYQAKQAEYIIKVNSYNKKVSSN
ncbi:MAG: DUF4124 domain-containing protein [Desulfamplus sp.]|nr:DUF4124 domain-containing protein [Desulfamplus sp.]